MRSRPILAVTIASLLCASAASASTIVVQPGQSIRAAIARARPGDRIEVLPGTYHEGSANDLNALTIGIDGIALVGRPERGRPVVLENAGAQSYGVWVSPADSSGPIPEADPEHPPCGLLGTGIRGFVIRGFTVRGFGRHGVHLACVDGFAMIGNVADGNDVYGLFPVVSKNGVISGNEAMNTGSDAAIYVGQSDNVLVAGNLVHDSLLAIEVENSRNCAVLFNEVHGNTFGIFVDILPFLERSTQVGTLVAGNSVHDNTRANTADPSDFLGLLPGGIGVLLSGADATTIVANRVERNPSAGIAVMNLCFGYALQGLDCDIDVDPFSDNNRIVGNVVLGNGTVPTGIPELDALMADLVWDGLGTGNCWQDNTFSTSVPPAAYLPSCR